MTMEMMFACFLWWHIYILCLAFVVFSYLRSLRMLDRFHIGQDGDIANLSLSSNMSPKVRITRQVFLLFVTIHKGRGRGTCEMYSGGLWCRFVKCYKKCFDLLISFSLSEFWIPKPFLPSPIVVIVLFLWGCSRRHFRDNLLIFVLRSGRIYTYSKYWN